MNEQSDHLRRIEEFFILVTYMLEDLNKSNEILGICLIIAKNNTDLSHLNSLIRMRVRLAISFLESISFSFKKIAQDLCLLSKRKIDPEFDKLLAENSRLDVKDKIKGSLKFVAIVLNRGYKPDFNTTEWQQVCMLIDKRHLLTHPNKIDDFAVSIRDLELVNTAILWIADQFYKIIGKRSPEINLTPSATEIDNMINNLKVKFPIFK